MHVRITIYALFFIGFVFNGAATAAKWTETSFEDFADGTYSDGGASVYATADGDLISPTCHSE